MEQKLRASISSREFGKAICNYIGKQTGHGFFPFRIVKSSFTPPETIEAEETDAYLPDLPDSPLREVDEGAHFILTREEVLYAVSSYSHLMRRKFERMKLMRIGCELPDRLEFVIEISPRSTKTNKDLHSYGGL